LRPSDRCAVRAGPNATANFRSILRRLIRSPVQRSGCEQKRGLNLLYNGKKNGQGNTKNGNKYLACAYVEVANYAVRFSAKIESFYQRKKSKTSGIVAIKVVAHKLCRACYYIMKDQVAFDITKGFARDVFMVGTGSELLKGLVHNHRI
jgi:hypothetical protein